VRRGRMSWRGRGILGAILVAAGLLAWGYLARRLAPASNTALTHFDAIVVLGDPADGDGNPTPIELARVTEGVREYERGVAPYLIFTGGAVANRFVEAQVMARTAEAQGIPEAAIVVEPAARDTIENACYSVRIMKARGWESAEIVSSAWHLARAALIFSRMPIAWRTHAAPPLQPSSGWHEDSEGIEETLKTVRYLVWGRPIERCEP
jgi:uncharacterized SAM-binding protein YcdF (DUF218 family)